MALTGGRTPDVVYEALLKTAIAWSKVPLLPTDDRLVPLDDPLSNYAKLTGFFGKTGAELVSLIDAASSGDYPEAARRGAAGSASTAVCRAGKEYVSTGILRRTPVN